MPTPYLPVFMAGPRRRSSDALDLHTLLPSGGYATDDDGQAMPVCLGGHMSIRTGGGANLANFPTPPATLVPPIWTTIDSDDPSKMLSAYPLKPASQRAFGRRCPVGCLAAPRSEDDLIRHFRGSHKNLAGILTPTLSLKIHKGFEGSALSWCPVHARMRGSHTLDRKPRDGVFRTRYRACLSCPPVVFPPYRAPIVSAFNTGRGSAPSSGVATIIALKSAASKSPVSASPPSAPSAPASPFIAPPVPASPSIASPPTTSPETASPVIAFPAITEPAIVQPTIAKAVEREPTPPMRSTPSPEVVAATDADPSWIEVVRKRPGRPLYRSRSRSPFSPRKSRFYSPSRSRSRSPFSPRKSRFRSPSRSRSRSPFSSRKSRFRKSPSPPDTPLATQRSEGPQWPFEVQTSTPVEVKTLTASRNNPSRPSRTRPPPFESTKLNAWKALSRKISPSEGRLYQEAIEAANKGRFPRGIKSLAGVSCSPADFASLGKGKWLSDTILAAFDNVLNTDPSRVFCFDTFFLPMLQQHGYEGVQKYGRRDGFDVRTAELILFPLHEGGNH